MHTTLTSRVEGDVNVFCGKLFVSKNVFFIKVHWPNKNDRTYHIRFNSKTWRTCTYIMALNVTTLPRSECENNIRHTVNKSSRHHDITTRDSILSRACATVLLIRKSCHAQSNL